jgi:tetratricopeptide (TPR) repeat protein
VLDQRNQNQVKITGDFLTRYFEDSATTTSTQHHDKHSANAKPAATSNMATSTPNSLADWARNVDLEPLLQKRKEIHRQKREGRPVTPKQTSQRQQPQTAEYLKSLARALKAPSSPFASNIKVKELYTASKQADQLGERMVAVDLLRTLLMVTPSDARVYRRLARMYTEQGDFVKARETLQAGLQRQKLNPWLWHGLGQLERNHGTLHLSREYFEKAIECDPTFAHSYHALGSMEHSKGNIANATRIIKKGLEYCPTNHRLWHACGDVYRAAQMMEDADRSYRRALKHGPPMSHCFAYTSLAAVAYEQGQIDLARSWLVKTLRVNNGRHAQGWVALAQLEEAEGRIQKAQLVCTSAIAQYERGLLEARQRFLRKNGQRSPEVPLKASNSTSSVEITNQLLRSVPRYRSGDKFVHVYRNWARLEERHGTVESVDRVYERAQIAFPQEYKLLLSWAHYHSSMFNHERARIIFQEACSKVGHR